MRPLSALSTVSLYPRFIMVEHGFLQASWKTNGRAQVLKRCTTILLFETRWTLLSSRRLVASMAMTWLLMGFKCSIWGWCSVAGNASSDTRVLRIKLFGIMQWTILQVASQPNKKHPKVSKFPGRDYSVRANQPWHLTFPECYYSPNGHPPYRSIPALSWSNMVFSKQAEKRMVAHKFSRDAQRFSCLRRAELS